jgi:hypothetical protein
MLQRILITVFWSFDITIGTMRNVFLLPPKMKPDDPLALADKQREYS